MLKAAIKQSSNDQIRHRVIPPDAIGSTAEELENLRSEVSEVLKEEKEEKAVGTLDDPSPSVCSFRVDSCGKPIWKCARVRT